MKAEEKQSPEKICLKCSGEMEAGVIADSYTDIAISMKVQTWIKGIPKKKSAVLGFPGIKKTVLTYRCNKCGFLESYAP